MKVYGCVICTATQRVLACLYEKQLDFEFVPVDMGFRAPESNDDPFLPMNPFGHLPVLEDGDITMFESRAISNHLLHSHIGKGTDLIVVPSDLKKMATLSTWLEVESQRFNPQASSLIFHLFYKPLFRMVRPDKSIVSGLEASLSKVLDVYEARLGNCSYLTGDECSLVDVNHLPMLHLIMTTTAKKLVECRPNVCRWATSILARPSWAKVLEAVDDGISANSSSLLSMFNKSCGLGIY